VKGRIARKKIAGRSRLLQSCDQRVDCKGGSVPRPPFAGRSPLLLWLDPSSPASKFFAPIVGRVMSAGRPPTVPLAARLLGYSVSFVNLLEGLQTVGRAEIVTTVDQPAIRVLVNA
jgi:hypothetical protein